MDVKIEQGWKHLLQKEFEQPYFSDIVNVLKKEKQEGRIIYPPGPQIFNAFQKTPVDKVKLVILGQDPYHNPGQAHGLSFSVPDGVQPPPSLVNIFKEIHAELGLPIPRTGNLEPWAEQGVLLLNAALTVQANQPMSHSKIGWHHFTDDVIRILSEKKDHLVFMLWGRFAQGKEALIDTSKHLVLKSAHPSPLSAHNGFFGNNHFRRANEWLEEKGITPIDWRL
ncbi:uracil-DNA glycosylase [Chitinophagaceae bacterium MMS25-I14]